MRLRRLGRQEGYSLPELITVMAILAIVLGALGELFVRASNSELDLNKRFQAQTEARQALDKVRREVHCASVIAPASSGAISPAANTSVTLTLPAGCPSGSGSVTWCTQGSGTRFGLYRMTGSACSGGTQYVDYLTTASVFTYYAQSTSSLAKLHVDFPVDVVPADPLRGYRLTDDIVLRNSTRT